MMWLLKVLLVMRAGVLAQPVSTETAHTLLNGNFLLWSNLGCLAIGLLLGFLLGAVIQMLRALFVENPFYVHEQLFLPPILKPRN